MDIVKIARAMMGKPKIYFANMGHGEAIAFEFKGQWYLRDFGEYTAKYVGVRCTVKKLLMPSEGSKCVFKNVFDEKNKANAIVSHSHRDHISGFEKLFNDALKKDLAQKKLFKSAYLPLVCKGNSDTLNYSCLVEGNVLLASFLKNSKNKDRSLLFLKSDIIMAALSENIVYCSAELPPPGPFKMVYCPLRSIASDNYERLFDIQKQINSFYERYFPNEDKRAAIKDNVRKIQAILEKYHKGVDRTAAIDTKDAKEDLNSIDGILEQNRKYREEDFKFGKLPNKIKNILDDSSLAFDICFSENSRWLFLGDNNDPVLRAALPENVKYDGIKTSHHGTRGAKVLNEKNITSEFMIACAGQGNDAFRPIEEEYASRGIVSLGVPPHDDVFVKNGGIIKSLPCLVYEDVTSDKCCSEPGSPKEGLRCMKGLPCVKCKNCDEK